MDDDATLREINAITTLKARYCRYLDTKHWDEWRALFTHDFVSDTSKAGGTIIIGADEFVGFVRGALGARPTVHQVHAPEIEITSAVSATGVWALHDIVRLRAGFDLHGYGHYHETYSKVDGNWLISGSTLTRVREDIVTPLLTVHVSARMRGYGAALARRLGH
ncbi:nuclear transport factor 2 family protein [Nocardia bovistercoris]|uniref:Nuclear transport factor 2 family protein n=1 Tax=Nocardia bovistercoris TaxID=2785916 RepID=A0A931IBW3_9NOCA|nr:nuclear transport factor 2 family protein [Nocardia bovistercoris]MBH0776973.1 nuclear transport factor 2 family protein [Nocardia bovistercoris]